MNTEGPTQRRGDAEGSGDMRLDPVDRKAVVEAVRAYDSKARVWLFGSRADDSKRGGDIDIAVLSGKLGRMEQIHVRRAIMDVMDGQGLSDHRRGGAPGFRKRY